MTKKSNKSPSFINYLDDLNIFYKIGIILLILAIASLIIQLSGSSFFYKNSTNSYKIVLPTKYQTVGGGSIEIDFNKNISHLSIPVEKIDIWVNEKHVHGEGINETEDNPIKQVFVGENLRIVLNQEMINEGDIIKISTKKINRTNAKLDGTKGFYLDASRSWVYANSDIPEIYNISKEPLVSPLRPEYKIYFYDKVDESLLTNAYSMYLGKSDGQGVDVECLGPEKKIKSKIKISKNGQSAVISSQKNIRRTNNVTCVYVLPNHLEAYYDTSHIDVFMRKDPKATLEVTDIFNPENNFYSNLKIDFDTPMLLGTEGSEDMEEFIEKREEEKNKLINNIVISPNAEIDLKKIYFSPTQAVIPMNLKAETKYSIILKPTKDIYRKKTNKEVIKVEMGAQEYLGIKLNESQSVYSDTSLPEFTLIQYKNPKSEIKLCRVGMNEYGIIEHFYNSRKELDNANYFFEKGIDLIKTEECFTKTIEVNEDEYKAEFNIDDLIGTPGKSGLYFMTFANDYERRVDANHSVQYPLFFSVVDTHLTMKISKNGKLFIWANDFDKGEGVPNLDIYAYKSNFISYTSNWDSNTRQYTTTYVDPINGVFEKPISLGKTNSNGFLETKIPSELNAYESSTENNWWDDSKSDSLVITASSNNNLTFVSNKWNDGIANWNFGYNPISIWDSRKGESNLMAHFFSERKLYLPGETVYLKAIIRKLKKTLDIPSKNKSFLIKIVDPEGSEILNETFHVNDYGSIFKEFKIDKNATLGTYRANLIYMGEENEEYIANTTFNIEEFQKPNFKVNLQLNSNDLDNSVITNPKINDFVSEWGYKYKEFSKEISINTNIQASYYSGGALKNAKYKYKVYKQYYYDNSYWDDCYWGCYWEPSKDFYSSGDGELSASGDSSIEIKVDHTSRWNDYKYIVEVTITDENGETITGSGSIIVKLPENKSVDPEVDLKILSNTQFAKKGDSLKIDLSPNKKWNEVYNNQYKLKVNKKIYTTTHKINTEGRLVPQVDFEEEEMYDMKINTTTFNLSENNTLSYNFIPDDTGEYVYEIYNNEGVMQDSYEIYIYDENEINNTPILDDNKFKVLSERVSYKIGETARFLVRLPFDNSKVLITTEKTHVIDKKLIDINNNVYLYEVKVDDTFVPNAYLSFIAFQKGGTDYKVGYAEIVVDKSEKNLDITSTFNKSKYKPRDEITVKFNTKDSSGDPIRSELTVAVVDESLIALLGNIDMDILKKFYKKISFQTDTSLTSVAMLNHIFFSRKGFVGGSGDKGGDSSVFTRSIFKNTAYYNNSVITDSNGNASIKFQLPDNIGDFRLIVLGSTKNGDFGAHENTLSIRKDLVIADAFPMIFRQGDEMKLGANIFNYTDEEVSVDVSLESDGLKVDKNVQKITILPQDKTFVTWESSIKNQPEKEIPYYITAVANNGETDRIQKTVEIVSTPLIADFYSYKNKFTDELEFEIEYDKQANKELSYLQFSASTSLLSGIDKIANSLLTYPHGCLEQLTSTTLPNALLLKLSDLFVIDVDYSEVNKNLEYGIKTILGMQKSDGGFAYWPGDSTTNHHYSPYGIWGLATMKNLGANVDSGQLKKAENYLINRFKETSSDMSNGHLSELATAFSALAKLNSDYFPRAREIMYSHKSEFNMHENIFYALALSEYDASKYHDEIINIVEKIDLKEGSSSYSYWSNDTYKAIFTQVLLNVDHNNSRIDTLIEQLYSNNFESYYYSTQTKIQSFISFIKYIESVGLNKDKPVSIRYNIGGKTGSFSLSGKNLLKKEKFVLSEFKSSIDKNYEFSFKVNGNDNENKVYIDADVVVYPKNKKDVTHSSNGVYIKKEIKGIEVDTNKKNWYADNIKEVDIDQNKLKIGETYMVKLEMEFDKSARDVSIEDHLPAGVKVLNPRFKTVSSDTDEMGYMWPFNHIEYKKNMVFATANRINSGKKYEFKYFITPTIEGVFTMPPVSVFPMYQPSIEAHTGYSELTIVK